jgi:hypothetical protein
VEALRAGKKNGALPIAALAALRNSIATLAHTGQAQLIATTGALVHADPRVPGSCPRCQGPLHVRKTLRRCGQTLEHGVFRAAETVYVCARGCTTTVPSANGGSKTSPVIQRSLPLAQLLLPRRSVGYDVMVFVGRQRWMEKQQREDIQADLKSRFGIPLSTGEISTLAGDFLVYLEALHIKCAPKLREQLARDGGWPMHIDATGEAGRGTLLVVYAGWRHWVLGSWKIPSEHADAILPRLRTMQTHFGTPCGLMHDCGRAVIEASRNFIQALDRPVPDLLCHFHLVRDIGKDLMAEAHQQLLALFRSHDVRGRLRAMARDLGRTLGTEIEKARQEVELWMATPDRSHLVPSGRAGLGTVRALAQWVLDYPKDGRDEGFPFDVPYLDLFERCKKACRAAEAFLCNPPDDTKVHHTLKRLHGIVVATRQPDFVALVGILQERRRLLGEFRTALHVEVKAHRATSLGLASKEALEEIREIKLALGQLILSLHARRPERGPAKNTRQAIDIVLTHIDRHGRSLWGHTIRLPQEIGGGVRLIDRTNVILEQFFGIDKHGERRRSGRKNLAADLERIPGPAALAANLKCPDYVEIVCGRLEGLPKAFAELDAADRSKALPARTFTTANGADTDVVRASMPKADLKIIRSDGLLQKIVAAVRSRAPRRAVPQARAAVS